ncbi:NAD(P)H-binding protein [Zhouia spongiae]|uniref:NAD(P)H-binding protein n=1 Tax=Zhouia spongiae TaxID=2202721 RepID=A0ABY3YR66_9FLAO|nr:NAD(P)H-binding protein [Zhouia spongiae]UNZ00068.1 NAD(P)H-binding protein [Zhouia spongiae]
MNNNIAIIGCGWLGRPLAGHLIKKGFHIKGSTTSEEKLSVLRAEGVDPYKITLYENSIKGNIHGLLSDTDTAIINIPPKLRRNNAENYVSKIRTLVYELEKANIKNLLFVSSTTVYSNNNRIITEESPRTANSKSGKQLKEIEDFLTNNNNLNTTILRFSGLIGNDRNPVTYLSGKKYIANPNAPVNLVHLDDCILIIERIVSGQIWNESFNVASPSHPSKENYYTQEANKRNITPPGFNHEKASEGKIISSDKLIRTLNYQFITEL